LARTVIKNSLNAAARIGGKFDHQRAAGYHSIQIKRRTVGPCPSPIGLNTLPRASHRPPPPRLTLCGDCGGSHNWSGQRVPCAHKSCLMPFADLKTRRSPDKSFAPLVYMLWYTARTDTHFGFRPTSGHLLTSRYVILSFLQNGLSAFPDISHL
jgi:hypothetical protein